MFPKIAQRSGSLANNYTWRCARTWGSLANGYVDDENVAFSCQCCRSQREWIARTCGSLTSLASANIPNDYVDSVAIARTWDSLGLANEDFGDYVDNRYGTANRTLDWRANINLLGYSAIKPNFYTPFISTS